MRPGSFLALSHLTDDAKPPVAVDGFRRAFDHATEQMHFRSKGQVERFFDGLQVIPPYDGRGAGHHLQRAVGRGGRATGRQRRLPLAVLRGREDPVKEAVGVKPTPEQLGIDPAVSPGRGPVTVTAPSRSPSRSAARWARGDWVLMRVAGDPAARILVFDRNEWECFIDGARNGEFDEAADAGRQHAVDSPHLRAAGRARAVRPVAIGPFSAARAVAWHASSSCENHRQAAESA